MYKRQQKAIAHYKSRGLSAKKAQDKANSHYMLTQRLVYTFMTIAHNGKDPKPIQWLYRSRLYSFKIRYTTIAKGKIQWIGDNVLYPKIWFSIS